ncbi:hypothetical protein LCGC14_0909070 [marine sediment metagenome]|uniref:Uncharacterized protein n=1 Tax=marine sediment metagenome TaxID=412755 RepID=A0A0F9RD18_9ZZZZ
MARIIDSRPLLRKFEKLERESRRKNNGNVNVGYGASYAPYVHENLEAAHGEAYNAKHAGRLKTKRDKQGRFLKGSGAKKGAGSRGAGQQAKFLEQPFREMNASGETRRNIVAAIKGGATLIQALLLAGLRIQRASQKIVPVDLGNLKGSAFTEKE